MSQYKIAPSILAADYANFEREIKRLEATGQNMPILILWTVTLCHKSVLVQVWSNLFVPIARWSLTAT